VLWWAGSLHEKDLVLLSHAPILAGRSRRRCNACCRRPIRVKGVLVVMLLTAWWLSLDAIALQKAPVGTMLASRMVLACALLVAVHWSLAEAPINDVDVT